MNYLLDALGFADDVLHGKHTFQQGCGAAPGKGYGAAGARMDSGEDSTPFRCLSGSSDAVGTGLPMRRTHGVESSASSRRAGFRGEGAGRGVGRQAG